MRVLSCSASPGNNPAIIAKYQRTAVVGVEQVQAQPASEGHGHTTRQRDARICHLLPTSDATPNRRIDCTIEAIEAIELIELIEVMEVRHFFFLGFSIWEFIRPFLIQSDSASRKRPFSTGLFSTGLFLALLIVSRVDFKVFVSSSRRLV